VRCYSGIGVLRGGRIKVRYLCQHGEGLVLVHGTVTEGPHPVMPRHTQTVVHHHTLGLACW
jgi:hypothetical protein